MNLSKTKRTKFAVSRLSGWRNYTGDPFVSYCGSNARKVIVSHFVKLFQE